MKKRKREPKGSLFFLRPKPSPVRGNSQCLPLTREGNRLRWRERRRTTPQMTNRRSVWLRISLPQPRFTRQLPHQREPWRGATPIAFPLRGRWMPEGQTDEVVTYSLFTFTSSLYSRPRPVSPCPSCALAAVNQGGMGNKDHQRTHHIFFPQTSQKRSHAIPHQRSRPQHQRAAKAAKGGVEVPRHGACPKACRAHKGIHRRKKGGREDDGCRSGNRAQRSCRKGKGENQQCSGLFHMYSPFRGSSRSTSCILCAYDTAERVP